MPPVPASDFGTALLWLFVLAAAALSIPLAMTIVTGVVTGLVIRGASLGYGSLIGCGLGVVGSALSVGCIIFFAVMDLRGCLISPSVLSNTGRSGVNCMGRPASLKVDSSASLRMTIVFRHPLRDNILWLPFILLVGPPGLLTATATFFSNPAA